MVRPSAIPVQLVCGPPGSGKSTYVRRHAGPDDIVIDLDEIKSELSRLSLYHAGPEWVGPALRERNARVRDLADARPGRRAWLILSAPDAELREVWATTLGAERVVVLPVIPSVCLARIKADARRVGSPTSWREVIADWWAAYQPSSIDAALKETA